MLNRLASLAMSTSVLKALPGKLDIKRHSPSISISRQASRYQQAFSKPCLVNLISKDTHLIISIYSYEELGLLFTELGDRLRDLNILVGKTQDSWSLCDYYAGPAASDEEVIIKCQQLIKGRYVKLQKVTDTDPLTLCEVEVMGRMEKSGKYK